MAAFCQQRILQFCIEQLIVILLDGLSKMYYTKSLIRTVFKNNEISVMEKIKKLCALIKFTFFKDFYYYISQKLATL